MGQAMSVRRKQRIQPRNPSIYSHYSPPIHAESKKSVPKNGPTTLVVGFVLLIAFVLASITYANLSQRNGDGIFGIAASKSESNLKKLAANACADNKHRQELVVSVNKQRMWACSYTVPVQNAPVVSGMERYAADLTPVGTYHITQKQQNIPLIGSDSNGGWSVHVDYWLQFLENQYGRYGFHDATWRKPTEFGHVNVYAPFSANPHGSRGCVEAPLAAMKWIYDWTAVGTTVVIKA